MGNVIGSRRSSWRILSSILQKQTETAYTSLATNLQKKIEDELSTLCKDVLDLLDTHLLPNSSSEESKVFFNKMKGDYHRRQASFRQRHLRARFSHRRVLQRFHSDHAIAQRQSHPLDFRHGQR